MADKPATSISGELRAVRATLNEVHSAAHRLPPPPIPPRTETRSTFAREASRWSPTGLALLISATVPLARIWNVNEDMKKDLKEAKAQIETLVKLEKEHRESFTDLSKRYAKFYSNEVAYREFSDIGFCELGVKPSHGCPDDVEFHPRPMKGSKAPPIQPKVRTKPLLPEDDE